MQLSVDRRAAPVGTGLRRGLTLVEMMISALVLLFSVVSALAFFPLGARLQESSAGYSRASSILHRKLEQVRRYRAEDLSISTLQTAGIVDAGEGNTRSFTGVDSMGTQLHSGTGSLTLSGVGTDLVQATALVRWRSFTGKWSEISAVTLVASKRFWVEP